MQKHLRRNNSFFLRVVVLYLCALLAFLLVHFAYFVQNRLAYASGILTQQKLSLDDFILIDMEMTEDGSLVCLSTDPQLIAKDSSIVAENLNFQAEYTLPPLLVNVFWADVGEVHSVRNMAYETDSAEGLFLLPPGGAYSLRIDPGIQAENIVTINSITINTKRDFGFFFIPSGGELALLLFLPSLLASCIEAVMCLLPKRLLDKNTFGCLDADKDGVGQYHD